MRRPGVSGRGARADLHALREGLSAGEWVVGEVQSPGLVGLLGLEADLDLGRLASSGPRLRRRAECGWWWTTPTSPRGCGQGASRRSRRREPGLEAASAPGLLKDDGGVLQPGLSLREPLCGCVRDVASVLSHDTSPATFDSERSPTCGAPGGGPPALSGPGELPGRRADPPRAGVLLNAHRPGRAERACDRRHESSPGGIDAGCDVAYIPLESRF
jgi:hypothetical protein